MPLIRPLFICLSLLLTSGCVTAPNNEIATDRLVGANRVGVLTQTSPLLHGKLVATTAFGNSAWESPEPRLMVADWVFEAAAKTLTRSVVRLDEVSLQQIRPLFNPRFLGTSPKPIAPETVKRLGADHDIQLLLVFSSSISSDFLAMTNQGMEAQGIFSRRFFGRAEDYSYFVANIEVYDARDGQRIKQIWCAEGGFLGFEIPWQDTWSAYTPEQQKTVLSSLAKTTQLAVKTALSRTNL